MNHFPATPPVIPPSPPRDRVERFFRWLSGALAGLLLLLALAAYGVTSYFRLSSEMAGLRDGLQAASGREWHRTIALNIGRFTFGAARAGLSLVKLEEEPRIALQTIQACEFGIYQTVADTETVDRSAMLSAADRAMAKQGWGRVVGVMDDEDLVAVYVPNDMSSPTRIKCAVMVCTGRQLILASTRANLDPAIKFALAKADFGKAGNLFAKR